ncbi:MAG: S8 family serine peptidase [Thermodesulfovibrionales bacterium]|nr:S8 family serine peptidase [Thermodesulfovibrionales bacterium]
MFLYGCGSPGAPGSSGSGQGNLSFNSDGGEISVSAASVSVMTIDEQRTKILSAMEAAPSGSYKAGEIIVKFKSETDHSQIADVHKKINATPIKKITNLNGLELVKPPAGMSVKDAVRQYMADPAVEYAEPNYIVKIKTTLPNDIYFPQQWALYNTGQFADGIAGSDIKAYLAWDITKGSNAVTIAVIDTGIDYNHNDLVLNIWNNSGETNCVDDIDNDGNGYVDDCIGWDFVTCSVYDENGICVTPKAPDNDPWDDYGHGTFVAGIIGAKGNNAIGIAGVMWNVKIMPLKVFNSQGYTTISAIVDAIVYAVNKGAKIINESFGGYEFSATEYNALNYANSAGVFVAAAAGNESINNDIYPLYPASFNLPNIISVAATDQKDMLASFSNFGPNSVHVAAPGVYILSTMPDNGYSDKEFWAGTSLSTPYVSGVAGLLMTYYQHFDIYQIKSTIEAYSDYLTNISGLYIKHGRLNAYRAVSSLLVPSGLAASSTQPESINLIWNDNATGESGYKIERMGAGEASFAQIADVSANSASYADNSVAASQTYTYRVRAYNSIGNSLYSNEASATTPAAPSGGGGGGCSVVPVYAKDQTESFDAAFIVLSVVAVAVFTRRKKTSL